MYDAETSNMRIFDAEGFYFLLFGHHFEVCQVKSMLFYYFLFYIVFYYTGMTELWQQLCHFCISIMQSSQKWGFEATAASKQPEGQI